MINFFFVVCVKQKREIQAPGEGNMPEKGFCQRKKG
jgi:hypothetical protein